MNNLSLESRCWNAFFIEDVAEIVSGRDIYEKERLDGLVPYITATANNNGVGYFVANNNDTLERGCLSVNRNGSFIIRMRLYTVMILANCVLKGITDMLLYSFPCA